jgi:hypothetical protein
VEGVVGWTWPLGRTMFREVRSVGCGLFTEFIVLWPLYRAFQVTGLAFATR